MHRFLTASAFLLFALPASAICTPPYQVAFSCDILASERQVEICGIPSDTVKDFMTDFTFNSAQRNQISDVFFQADSAYSVSLKHYESGSPNTYFGIGYEDSGRYYTAYATGSYVTGQMYQGFVEVFDSVEAFHSDALDQHAERWECAYGTLQGTYGTFRP